MGKILPQPPDLVSCSCFGSPFFHIVVSWTFVMKHFTQPGFPQLWNNLLNGGIPIPFSFEYIDLHFSSFLRFLLYIYYLLCVCLSVYLCVRVCDCVCLSICMSACVCVCWGQRATSRSLFFRSITWFSGTELRSLDLVASTFTQRSHLAGSSSAFQFHWSKHPLAMMF